MEKKKHNKRKLYKLKNTTRDEIQWFETREEAVQAGKACMRKGHNAVLSEVEE